MLALCSRLEYVLHAQSASMTSRDVQVRQAAAEKAEELLGQVSDLMQPLLGDEAQGSLAVYFTQSGLANLFPSLAARIGAQLQQTGSKRDSFTLKEYLRQVNYWNQVTALCSQISDDVDVPGNHKYMAHQLALLYQSISQAGSSQLSPFKKRIEAKFEIVKQVTEKTDKPGLPEDLRVWIRAICAEISGVIASVPPSLARRLSPLLVHIQSR